LAFLFPEIDFPEFDQGQEFQAEYAFSHLPETPPTSGINLAIWDPDQKFRSDSPRKQLTANFKFDLVDENGAVLAQLDRPLSEMRWARPEGGDYGLYQLDESFFQPSGDTQYRLRVPFAPDSALEGMKGFIHIRCGGGI
jgi:hypothetical protein